jgi:lipoprotein NlpD
MMRRYLFPIILLALAGCGSRPPAPVGDRAASVVVEGAPAGAVAAPVVAGPAVARPGYYIVKKGDTVRRIAQEHGQDYRDVAAWNNMTDPSKIEIGQELRVAPPDGAAVVKPIAVSAPIVVVTDAAPVVASSGSDQLKREPKGGKVAYSEQALAQVRTMEGGAAAAQAVKPLDKPADKPAAPTAPPAGAAIPGGDAIDWTWPIAGKVLSEFVEGGAGRESNKGIDLAGRTGEPIQAAAAGKVNFVGSLRGYGDFLVVQHQNSEFISVYAHTSKILVKKDQMVAKGQKIAEVGSSDADQPKLHFEIRRQGKPVDPLKLLPAR